MDDRFKISHIILSLSLIAVFITGCWFIVRFLIHINFYWLYLIPCFLSFAIAVFFIIRICIPLIIEELKKLRKRSQ